MAQSSEPRRHDGQMMRRRPGSPLRPAACFRPLPFGTVLQTSLSPRRARAGGRPMRRGDQVTAEGEEVVVAGTDLWIDKDLPVCRRGVTHVGMRSPTSPQRHSRVRHTEVAEIRKVSTPPIANLLPEKRVFPHYRRCSSMWEVRQIDREGTGGHALMAPRPTRHVMESFQHLNCQCRPSVPPWTGSWFAPSARRGVARGNPVGVRDCLAAVSGNDRRHEALGPHVTWEATVSRCPVLRDVPTSPKTCHCSCEV